MTTSATLLGRIRFLAGIALQVESARRQSAALLQTIAEAKTSVARLRADLAQIEGLPLVEFVRSE